MGEGWLTRGSGRATELERDLLVYSTSCLNRSQAAVLTVLPFIGFLAIAHWNVFMGLIVGSLVAAIAYSQVVVHRYVFSPTGIGHEISFLDFLIRKESIPIDHISRALVVKESARHSAVFSVEVLHQDGSLPVPHLADLEACDQIVQFITVQLKAAEGSDK